MGWVTKKVLDMAEKPASSMRRKLLLGGLAMGAAGAALIVKPSSRGRNHEPYYQQLSDALDRAQISQPTMVIDRAILNDNIASLKAHIGNRFDYRIVAKSLPSLPLLDIVMRGAGTNRLMLFHQPFLTQVARRFPQSDVLMGKPLPVQAAKNFYGSVDTQDTFDSSKQLQWLIDSLPRLKQYQALAESLNSAMQINIELDVGLHRGGVQDDQELVDMLMLIEADPRLSCSGFMGYEPHIAKLPFDKIKLRDKAMAVYAGKVSVAEQVLGRSVEDLTLNAGGSPTYRLYNEGDFPHNELAAGSCLVKPTDFDSPELIDHQPAAFIATPVLKKIQTTQLPGIEGLGKLMSFWDPNRAQAFFTYGGYWKAKPESPAGLSVNPLYGRSTNQEMLNGSRDIQMQQDDWVFLRPTQSESVFLQFGDIAVFEQGEIVDRWPVLSANA